MSKTLKPRRGTVITMTSTKKDIVLAKGEMFIEVPSNGVGTGPSRLIMGNGTDSYEALSNNHKYAIDGVTGYNTSDVYADSTYTNANDILDDVVNGKTIRNLFGNLKKAVAKNTADIAAIDTNQKAIISHVGMVIHSTTLDTEEKVKAIYGSNTTWIQHTGYMLRGATTGVKSGTSGQSNDGGADSVSVSSVASHNHTQDSHNHTQDSHNHTQNSHSHNINYGWGASLATGGVQYATGAAYAGTFGGNGTTASNQAKTATNQAKTATNQAKGSTYSLTTLPKYKNVYIWERTA